MEITPARIRYWESMRGKSHGHKTNNGITLCHNHHPRKRIEEKQLVPVFQSLILSKI